MGEEVGLSGTAGSQAHWSRIHPSLPCISLPWRSLASALAYCFARSAAFWPTKGGGFPPLGLKGGCTGDVVTGTLGTSGGGLTVSAPNLTLSSNPTELVITRAVPTGWGVNCVMCFGVHFDQLANWSPT
uniref:Uncharacterized protein n=1 Tax=Eutreptiella gymnastica TaxID=73025 RepID=A0A7S1I1M5_9EUGL|mmetsp:Transcript_122490/g.212363  ORF Transcript_122490/g.212363 Transcript_122490/m.212363 type:complete len:129 (+) Transcript_122490:93-479(+)